MAESWTLKGEMALSCSGMVFCPCVLSLGEHPPTEDRCQTWAGIRIDDGHFDMVDLSGIKVGLMMDLPGIMARGNWTAALCIVCLDKYGSGAISPIKGKEREQSVTIRNNQCWIGPGVIVSSADKSRFRGFGRNWNLAGRSAEIVKLDWGNQ